MKTAISVPDETFRAADRVARRLGMSRSELYSVAVREYIGAHGGEGVTEALDRIYAAETSPMDPVLAAMQLQTLQSADPW